MKKFSFCLVGASFLLIGLVGCGSDGSYPASGETVNGSAVLLGQLASSAPIDVTQPDLVGECPNVAVSINGSPATLELGESCDFLIRDVPAVEQVEITVVLPDQGIVGSIELTNVEDGEILALEVISGFDSLSLAVDRRISPTVEEVLPEIITENDVGLSLPAGLFDQDLTIDGNAFSLTGEAGAACSIENADPVGGEEGVEVIIEEDWTTIGGTVQINGYGAIFQNIKFLGPVEVRSKDASFINCCFGGDLLIFGDTPAADTGGISAMKVNKKHPYHHLPFWSGFADFGE